MDRKIEKKVITPKKVITIVTGLIIIGFIINFITSDHSRKLNVAKEKITITTVTFGDFKDYIRVTATAVPQQTIFLDATESGIVDTLFIDAGTFVKKGDRILKLSNADLELDIMQRKALLYEQINLLRNTRLAIEQNKISLQSELLDVDFKLKKAKRQYDLHTDIGQNKFISKMERDEQEDNYQYLLEKKKIVLNNFKQDSLTRTVQIEQLASSVKNMEKTLEMIHYKLERLTLKAPISGQLTSLNAQEGESIQAGKRFGKIDNVESYKLTMSIDQYYINKIELNQPGSFEVNGRFYEAEISKVYPEVINGSFDIEMKLVNNEPFNLRKGQTFQLSLELGMPEKGVLLKKGRFFQSTGGQWVFVVNKEGNIAEKRFITVGRQNPEFYYISSGLANNEKVIISSYESFGDADILIIK
ncbi:MAG: HlyD family efflux transporter periplasmic adaptor subunit [Bacteroidetes bacterium]|nr:HlyD family efflux transporter periplasmic adaptor subunit [Bacteroidota bacterium]MBL7110229.1 HlyD family efflux transporter periplasmic adaptor subunit [Candidatus Neomarinimicrobiota bacterium]